MKKKLLSLLLLVSISLVGGTSSIAAATLVDNTATTSITEATATPVDNTATTSITEATATPVDNTAATSITEETATSLAEDVQNSMSNLPFMTYSSSSSFSQYGYVGYGFTTSGDGVYRVQSFLHGFCYFVSNSSLYDCGSIDGIWGPNTERAVIHFQQYSGLVDDGVVGPATWAIIDQWNANHGI